MLRTRLLTAIVLIPIVIGLIYLGNVPFLLLVMSFMTVAEFEFCRLITRDDFQPTFIFGVALVWLFLLDSQFAGERLLRPGLVAIWCFSLIWQLAGRRHSEMTKWAGVMASGVYVGLYGSHLIRLRQLPGDGLWWTLVVVPAILVIDAAAYFVGSALGRHKLVPSLSFGKTWEGYAGGLVVGALIAAFLAWLWSLTAGPGSTITAARGFALGGLIGLLAPVGDLVVSMVKREAGVEDSGRALPGHGGALDRLDTVLWAAVVGYYYAAWLLH